MTFVEALPLFMFLALGTLLFTGFPVAFILGGIGLGFAFFAQELGAFNMARLAILPNRIFGGTMENPVLVAIPMFIYMGTMLEKSGVAKDLLHCLQVLTRRVPGGLALSVTLMGTIMAATTGIIGASVVMMTLMALPVMLKANYSNSRLALLEFRRRIETYQHAVMVWQFCRQVWARWMDTAVMAGALDLSAYEKRRREYLACSWLPPKWDWVDPMKDARAEIEQIGAGLKSRTQALAERGFDAEQVDAEIAADREREKSLGLIFAAASPSAPAPNEAAADPASN